MKARELKRKYFDFFKGKQHRVISSASLIPEHDPTALFISAGMHPLVPYLLGQKHPQGKRLVNVQKCIRTGDIDLVGDDSHLTFIEMLGNWSLGDYWKKEAIEWSYEFLTKILKFDSKKIYITCFKGDKDAPKDIESAKVWQSLGIPKERIFFLPKKDNWWGPAGKTGPCGPDTEMFIDTGKPKCSRDCMPGCNCGKYFEIWNDVFMEYNKTKSGKYEKLKQQNVDTGMGVERTAAMLQGKKNVYETEVFKPIVDKIRQLAEKGDERAVRIIADHTKAATFILAEGTVVPSNLDQGYVLRRLIRRAIRYGKRIGIEREFLTDLADIVITIYKDDYSELNKNKNFILNELKKEDERFRNILEKGLKHFERISQGKKIISGKDIFLLFQSYGFPLEITEDLAKEKRIKIDKEGFEKEFKKHQELSRKGAEKRFKGGLADSSVETTKLHTATHLLNEALRRVLKKDIKQRGSNITPERLRFDFNFERKLAEEEIKKVEEMVNEQIRKKLPVKREEMAFKEAREKGAQAVFEHKYGEIVSVYSIGNFSFEVCGGPHVNNTRELGHFKITKEEAVAAGIRRIKARLE